jgi:hypothetical protein
MKPRMRIYVSATRDLGDLAGVFEFDGDSCYFYLFSVDDALGGKVLDALPVVTGAPDFAAEDVDVRWDPAAALVGLFIRGVLWAVLAHTRNAHGGHYRPGSRPRLPEHVEAAFRAG